MKTINEIFGAELVNVENFAKKNLKAMCKLWNEQDPESGYFEGTIDDVKFDVMCGTWWTNKHTCGNTRIEFEYVFNGYRYTLSYYRKKFEIENQHCLDESAYEMEISAFKPGQIINNNYEIYLEDGVKKVRSKNGLGRDCGLTGIKKENFYDEENMKYIEREWFQWGCPVESISFFSDGTRKYYDYD